MRNHMQQIRYMIEGMRPHQWIKNLFVFAAPIFGKQLFVPSKFFAVCVTFAAFCLLSSAVYLLNDLTDLEEDRQHPSKRRRPLPSGRLRPGFAQGGAAVVGVVSLGALFLLAPWQAGMVAVVYLATNVLYSVFLKHVVILDVMFIAAGFIFRILAGSFATGVRPSYWLLLCTLNVSLFLGFVKRRAEITTLGDAAPNHRSVLAHYSPAFLDQMISIVTGATLVCYILYAVDPQTETRMLVATVPFVMYGLFRYLYLSYHLSQGGNPTKVVLLDKAFLLNVGLWGLACIIIMYYHETIRGWLPV